MPHIIAQSLLRNHYIRMKQSLVYTSAKAASLLLSGKVGRLEFFVVLVYVLSYAKAFNNSDGLPLNKSKQRFGGLPGEETVFGLR